MAKSKTASAPNPVVTAPEVPPKPKKTKAGNAPLVKHYLLAYNVLSAAGWGYILILTLVHLLNLDGRSSEVPFSAVSKAPVSTISRLLSALPFFNAPTAAAPMKIPTRIPGFLVPVYLRSLTTYIRVSGTVAVVQTCALLEVVHSLLGWVRSPLQTTAMQVASRLWIVWGIMQQFGVAQANPLYTSAVVAWSITEVVRYSFYASNLLGREPPVLLYLRYTLFYVLYPIGAGSEAFLSYATLPVPSGIPRPSALRGWSAPEYARGILFLIWWPALYQLYTYMMAQRRKIYGPRSKSKTN